MGVIVKVVLTMDKGQRFIRQTQMVCYYDNSRLLSSS